MAVAELLPEIAEWLPVVFKRENVKKKPRQRGGIYVGGGWGTPQAVGALRCGDSLPAAILNGSHSFKNSLRGECFMSRHYCHNHSGNPTFRKSECTHIFISVVTRIFVREEKAGSEHWCGTINPSD
jgi:hypothetical protein